jgi:3-dehydroquinate synthase
MEYLQQEFSVRFTYKVFFTTHIFSSDNSLLHEFLKENQKSDVVHKILFVIDSGVIKHHPGIQQHIREYFSLVQHTILVDEMIVIEGGEAAKNDEKLFYEIVQAVDKHGIDRHSYIAAIGGGSLLDLVGYAAAVSHRGIRHIRIPTTVLSQNDSGVGVKNGINFGGKKNFLGTFAPPVVVLNDYHFLTTLQDVDWRAGISEAIKVALIKDATFFHWLVDNAEMLAQRNMEAMQYLIKRCAELHIQHIGSRDPFETGSSRPLDFGHWSAHKLEPLTNFYLRHGEAVAIGIALDSTYSHLSGRLTMEDLKKIIALLKTLGLPIAHALLHIESESSPLLKGLQEFREHLGGKLTIMLISAIGKGEEVHHMDSALIKEAGQWLLQYDAQLSIKY